MESAGLRSVRVHSKDANQGGQKRKASDIRDLNEPVQKKQKVSSRSRALPKTKKALKLDNKSLQAEPLARPAGETPAYSNSRAAICDSLVFYKSHQSGVHSKQKACTATGVLLNGKTTPRDVLQSQVIVTTIGGGFSNDKDGRYVRTKNQSATSKNYTYLENAMNKGQPVGVVIGKQAQGKKRYANNLVSIELEHHFNVLDWFFVTEIWPEPQPTQSDGTSFIHYMIRLQKIDLSSISWWMPQGQERNGMFAVGQFHCRTSTCESCNTESKEIFQEGWCCRTMNCPNFFRFQHPGVDADALQYNDNFLNERATRDPTVEVGPLIPELPVLKPECYGSEKEFKNGIVCPDCKSATQRKSWDGWTCDKCGFQLLMIPKDVEMLKVHEETNRAFGIHKNKFYSVDTRILRRQHTVPGYEVTSFYLPNDPKNHGEARFIGSVSVFRPSKSALERQEGLDSLFQEIQKATRVGDVKLQRRPAFCPGSHMEELTSHFACNMGADYKFGVVVKTSNSFETAPPPIMKAVSRLTWCGAKAVELVSSCASKSRLSVDSTSMPNKFIDFNEELILGYFEESKISYHDDGEKELGPTVATLSLGSPSIMSFRGKKKTGFGTEDKASPALLSFIVEHGDAVIMHGTRIHQYFEHQVVAAGIRRFGLTCRYIRPEMIADPDRRQLAIENGKVPLYWQKQAYTGEPA
ncbi:hypothetical protein F5B22DRAFT_661958 [Xylaria bambusicola]|uniref:uncharacterized protein n=1 Tax=Xylaria bambusicola TaxID=326684 RepID=UPI0020079C89|nr:uncharacterized protein F5B22DRAFT_661958 [Xylaria bambusicola]KAI0521616.1 hypothetical protein F5B22DRAFT_661958 [Xylaria bambusicola]